jgi:hypothetical protein
MQGLHVLMGPYGYLVCKNVLPDRRKSWMHVVLFASRRARVHFNATFSVPSLVFFTPTKSLEIQGKCDSPFSNHLITQPFQSAGCTKLKIICRDAI